MVTTDAVVRLVGAAVESDDVLAQLPSVWQERIADPVAAAEIAALLRIDTGQLKSLGTPPIDVVQDGAGLNASDLLIVVATWVGTEVLLKSLADLGREAVKDAIRTIWARHLKPGLERMQTKYRALGDEVNPDKSTPNP